jgi:uncharacterized protein YjbI with pentapeptide repeats
MANEEHVSLLRRGREVWNAWRNANPDIKPNLNQANLTGANLGAASLTKANRGHDKNCA